MKIKNDKEIIVGKIDNRLFTKDLEVPFFVRDIRQLYFSPYEDTEHMYSVLISTALKDDTASLFISKEQYEYLMEKLGANDDEN